MRIIETRDMAEILRIVPQECEIRQRGLDRKPLKDLLGELKRRTESDPDFHVLIAFDKADRMTAYTFFELRINALEQRLTIYRVWSDTERPLGLIRLWQQLREIVKAYALETVNVLAPAPEAVKIAKNWGFRPVGMLMENKKIGRTAR